MQVFARILGTIILTLLLHSNLVPPTFGLSETEIQIIGYLAIGGGAGLWHWLELRSKGLTVNSPNPPANLLGVSHPPALLNAPNAPTTISNNLPPSVLPNPKA